MRSRGLRTKSKAKVRLKFATEERLLTVLNSLDPEVKTPTSHRARANLKKEFNFLVVTIEAEDTVALRASLNAYMRWINSIMNVLEVVKDSGPQRSTYALRKC
jgi:tRNA threonylcarbamoyladenosine modification (KEOPS) complex  Pcc1 subunit